MAPVLGVLDFGRDFPVPIVPCPLFPFAFLWQAAVAAAQAPPESMVPACQGTQTCISGSHFPLMQSRLIKHCLKLPQGIQFGPPQSTSVSSPSFIPSIHVVCKQRPRWQTKLGGQQTRFATVVPHTTLGGRQQ